MGNATFGDYSSLVMAAIVLIIVLIVIYMVLQYYYLKKPAAAPVKAPFAGTNYYAPACGSASQGRDRAFCYGPTAGIMPSLEYPYRCGGTLGCGLLGVPP
jgi:hypothetical protein